jgi:pimeloyl-ACP methyl ester carboxylesterase
MKFAVDRALSGAFCTILLWAGLTSTPSLAEPIPYGNNASAAHTVSVNGIRVYYETYGSGPPVLLLHGNGGSIEAFKAQIPALARGHAVIALDSRAHGHTEQGAERLTYELMAEDVNAVLDQLHVAPVAIVGHSDGGILALLLAIHHPDKVDRLAVMGANVEPSGAYDWAVHGVARTRARLEASLADTPSTQGLPLPLQLLDLLGNQPHIRLTELATITAPTLVMAGDRDVIRDDHTLSLFHAIPQSQLAIFPGGTHMYPQQDAERFNRVVLDFLDRPFSMPDTKDLGWFDWRPLRDAPTDIRSRGISARARTPR